jgi:hypothetical protein
VAGTDLEPVVTMSTKERFLAEVRERDYLVVMYHEHHTPVGRLRNGDFDPI